MGFPRPKGWKSDAPNAAERRRHTSCCWYSGRYNTYEEYLKESKGRVGHRMLGVPYFVEVRKTIPQGLSGDVRHAFMQFVNHWWRFGKHEKTWQDFVDSDNRLTPLPDDDDAKLEYIAEQRKRKGLKPAFAEDARSTRKSSCARGWSCDSLLVEPLTAAIRIQRRAYAAIGVKKTDVEIEAEVKARLKSKSGAL